MAEPGLPSSTRMTQSYRVIFVVLGRFRSAVVDSLRQANHILRALNVRCVCGRLCGLYVAFLRLLPVAWASRVKRCFLEDNYTKYTYVSDILHVSAKIELS